MTNASAMTLVLLVFVALFVGAVVVIFFGGTVLQRPRRPRANAEINHHHPRAA